MVHPESGRVGSWVVAVAVVLVAGGLLGYLVTVEGINWAPSDQPPWAGWRDLGP